MPPKRAHIPREEFAKAAAAAAAAGVVTAAAGKVVHDTGVAEKVVDKVTEKVGKGKKRSRAFRLKDAEPVPEGVRRIALGRIGHALEELRGKSSSPPAEAIHEARKDIKKLRALLRLTRGELGDGIYKRENDALRGAARGLAGARDADVMIETLDAIAERYPKRVPKEVAQGLMAALHAHRRSLEKDGEAGRRTLGQAVETLRDVRNRVEEWPLAHDSFDALEPGLRRTYRRGRKAYQAALEDPSTENLHAWRRRVKDHWHHHQLLKNSWPELMEPFADTAHDLADLLGDDHDLAVLREWAWAHPHVVGDIPGLEELADAVGRRRAQLQKEAFEIGSRLYAERPRDFARRLRLYWSAWRELPSPEQAGLG